MTERAEFYALTDRCEAYLWRLQAVESDYNGSMPDQLELRWLETYSL